jgi:hypothetical protein
MQQTLLVSQVSILLTEVKIISAFIAITFAKGIRVAGRGSLIRKALKN